MSQTIKKKFKYRFGVTEIRTLSHKCWREIKKLRKKSNRAYHKQKMNKILDDGADQSYQKVMPW